MDNKYICNICKKNYKSQQSFCNHNKKFHFNIKINISQNKPEISQNKPDDNSMISQNKPVENIKGVKKHICTV